MDTKKTADVEASPSRKQQEAHGVLIGNLVPGRKVGKVTFLRRSPNPYREDDADVIDIYADEFGFEYWIDPNAGVLVQAGPSARVHPAQRHTANSDRKRIGELRAMAVEIAARTCPEFAAKRSGFSPLEDNRHRETYYFRWDDFSKSVPESELPPFVQVGLHADGTLASYTDIMRRAAK